MAGKAKAVENGEDLKRAVVDLALALGLAARTEVKVGRRLWGAQRRIDVVLEHQETRAKLGLECKFQGSSGTAEEKIPATIEDIKAWPIRGLVVFNGPGFSDNMRGYLTSTGMAVQFDDLEDWLRMFFPL